jgi:hypothetical protein
VIAFHTQKLFNGLSITGEICSEGKLCEAGWAR